MAQKKKVIVIGLDGLEPSIVEAMLSRGELPNLARIKASGAYTRLKTTYPAQTPVAWSSFATGTNPGAHGIFDFVARNPKTYYPEYALNRFAPGKNMFSPPRVVNQRRGIPFWQTLAAAGIPCSVVRCPCTFPPDEIPNGRVLGGVGVPDLRGGQGTGAFYTQDRTIKVKESEQVVHLPAGDSFATHLIGPRKPGANPPADITHEIRVEARRPEKKIILHTNGSPEKVEVPLGDWSPWVRVKFKLSMLQSVAGMVRIYLRQLEPHIEFYVSPANYDPAAPMFPISWPNEMAKELSETLGLYSTLGMAEDHTALNNGRIDEAAYLKQCNLILAERERMMLHELARFREGLFLIVFDTPDRVQHMFWRFRDKSHPLYDPDLARHYERQIEDEYKRYDALLAKPLEAADADTLFIVLSDHGFNAFRRAFHVNTWLHENGLLALRDGKKPSEDLGDYFAAVDWSKTYAYALGLCGVYLNKKGREQHGILDEGSEAERVRNAIATGLTGIADSQSQQVAIHSVSRAEQIYNGAFAAEAPDLLVNYAPGFRVSWQTALGGMPHTLFEDNTRRWSGDHIINPETVPGILFLNRPAPHATNGRPADIRDLAPTILNFFAVPNSPAIEGRSLL